MDELMNASSNEINMIFNDELVTFLCQLISVAKQMNMKKSEFIKVETSKTKLVQSIEINKSLCINLYATFLLDPKFESFLTNIQQRNYKYFYDLTESETFDDDFKDLMIIIKSVSYDVSNEIKDDIFGYVENLTILASVFAMKFEKK